MKIFSIYSDVYPAEPSVRNTYLLADSAFLKNNKPFFLPEEGAPYAAYSALVAPVTRVGKTISRRFASRYYSDILPAVLFRAEGDIRTLSDEKCLLTNALSFDGALNTGFPAKGETIVWMNGDDRVECNIAEIKPLINLWIEQLSIRNTLRTGDLLAFPVAQLTEVLQEDMKIEASSDGQQLMKFFIK